jgi:hypothetical protein
VCGKVAQKLCTNVGSGKTRQEDDGIAKLHIEDISQLEVPLAANATHH